MKMPSLPELPRLPSAVLDWLPPGMRGEARKWARAFGEECARRAVEAEREQMRLMREALEHCEQWLPEDCSAAIEARNVLASIRRKD